MVASTTSPTTITLLSVPKPGRRRSGSQATSTSAAVPMTTQPIDRPVTPASPWWRTSQGPRPRSARTISAKLAPKATRPRYSCDTGRANVAWACPHNPLAGAAGQCPVVDRSPPWNPTITDMSTTYLI